ncbi:phage tail tape measure protein [Streptomyces sp. DSM 42041]|uniref:Phage tail tape measure protein n=1 Tax=Streptomyces hazeniae TaxID=3075538 RepID=A0ABU2NWR8_9ACTN|nr:phage tail tape measure protein [Streptomyces sp. DSM 42041]MDT0381436.1 phage tail tape measure protein [Streptomyces sp. DSM 42041]
MARAGAVWVDVLPNMSRFSRELDRQISEPIVTASREAGEEGGEAAARGMSDSLKTGAAAVGVAAGAALTAGLMEGLEAEKATSRLQAQLGLSGKDAQRAGKAAGNLYTSAVTESVEDGAAAVRAIMSAGIAPAGATTRQLESIATKVADVSGLFETDLGQTANAVGQILKTGLAKDATEAFDVITRGLQIMGPRADDLMDTFNEYSTIFRSVGLDAKTAVGLMTQGMKAGARDTDVVADAIKEFTIEAVAGGERVRGGFKSIGLDADTMVKTFAKGGPAAGKALDTVLDRLRAMPPGAERNAAAIELFGTKAEDMGDALFALDPSKAENALGRVGGAARKAGDDLRDNTAVQFEQFKRDAMQGLATVVMQDVVPAARAVAPVFATALAPVRELWQWLSADPGRMRAAATAVMAIVGAVIAFKVAAAAVSGARALWGGMQAAGTAARTAAGHVRFAAFAVRYYTVVGAQAAKQAVITGARWVASAARSGAAWAGARARAVGSFLATSRAAVVNAARTAATWTATALRAGMGWAAARARAVGSFVATAASATGNAARTAGAWVAAQARTMAATVRSTVALAAQRTAMVAGTVATKAAAAGQWLLNAAMRANPIGIVITALVALGALFVVLWKRSTTFRNIVQGAMRGVMVAVRAVGAAGLWLWRNALQPAFRGVANVATWLWRNVISRYFAMIRAIFRGVGAVASWLYRNAIKPAFNGVASVVRWLYDKTIKPVLDKGRSAVRLFGAAFRHAKEVIGEQWSKLKSIARKPIQFIVDTVYNNGIRGVWNKVAGAFGAKKLPRFEFASGGIMPGYTPGRDVHHFASPSGGRLSLSGGESIMRPEFTRAVGARFVNGMNQLATSRGARGVRQALSPLLGGNPRTSVESAYAAGGVVPHQRFADGGIFGWIGDKLGGAGSAVWSAVKATTSWLKDGIAASARAGVNTVVRPLLANFPGMDTGFGKMLRRIPDRMISALFGYSKEADKRGGAAIGGPAVARALRWARTQHGKPYQWGGNGNPSWDCSGFVSAIESVIRGQRPHRRWSTHAFAGGAPPGWQRGVKAPFTVGITHAGVGHTAGTLSGTNVESRGGDGVLVGPRARGTNSGMFSSWYGFTGKGYARGGRPRPGWSMFGEQGPELARVGSSTRIFDHRESMRLVGEEVGAAVVAGMATVAPVVARSYAHAAAPAHGASSPGGQDGALRRGDTVVLRIGEREFVALVDERVDDGMDKARRRKRAGVK